MMLIILLLTGCTRSLVAQTSYAQSNAAYRSLYYRPYHYRSPRYYKYVRIQKPRKYKSHSWRYTYG